MAVCLDSLKEHTIQRFMYICRSIMTSIATLCSVGKEYGDSCHNCKRKCVGTSDCTCGLVKINQPAYTSRGRLKHMYLNQPVSVQSIHFTTYFVQVLFRLYKLYILYSFSLTCTLTNVLQCAGFGGGDNVLQ